MPPLKPFIALFFLLPCLAKAQAPLISLRYDAPADERCASAHGYEIKEAWVEELRSRLPEMQALWESAAPPMLAAVRKLTNKSLDPLPATVLLTLCDSPSQSRFGISVNMRFALGAFTANPVPLRYKVDTAFHELLHGFVSRHVPENSPLLERHKSESACVRNHLHLLSLQKAVLLSLGQQTELEQVIRIDTQLPSGCYSKAWAIVNESGSTYMQYVEELFHRRPAQSLDHRPAQHFAQAPPAGAERQQCARSAARDRHPG